MRTVLFFLLIFALNFSIKASDTLYINKSKFINSWLKDIKCKSSAYGTSVPGGDTVLYLTGYGTGVDYSLYLNKTALPIEIGSGTVYTNTTYWTNVTSTGMTRDLFLYKFQSPFLIDSLIITSNNFKVKFLDKNHPTDSTIWRYSYKWGNGANGDTLSEKTFIKPGFYTLIASKILIDNSYQIGSAYTNQITRYNIIVTRSAIFRKLKLSAYKLNN